MAYNEIDVEEEEDVKEEVGGSGGDETPHVDCAGDVEAVDDKQRHGGMPHTDTAQDCHRRQDVLVLSQNTHTHTHTHTHTLKTTSATTTVLKTLKVAFWILQNT